jgi:hypothetical protein
MSLARKDRSFYDCGKPGDSQPLLVPVGTRARTCRAGPWPPHIAGDAELPSPRGGRRSLNEHFLAEYSGPQPVCLPRFPPPSITLHWCPFGRVVSPIP